MARKRKRKNNTQELPLCELGIHSPSRDGSKCRRCGKKLALAGDAGLFALFGTLFGAFANGFRDARVYRTTGPLFDPDFMPPPHYPPIYRPATDDWRRVLGFADYSAPSIEEVKARYRELSRECHPDLDPKHVGNPEQFRKITAARDAALEEFHG